MSEIETPVENSLPEKIAPEPRAVFRVRVAYRRGAALRYVSHLDMQTVWERTLRRAGVALAYSKGFNPRPRLHLASALPLGFTSQHELTDFWLSLPPGSPPPDMGALTRLLETSSPPGLEIETVALADLSLPALQTQVQAAEYLAVPMDAMEADGLSNAVQSLLAAESLMRERRGKPYDLRKLVEALEVRPASDGSPALFMRLTAREGATGRPEEVLDALKLDATVFRVERLKLILGE